MVKVMYKKNYPKNQEQEVKNANSKNLKGVEWNIKWVKLFVSLCVCKVK